MDILSLSLQSFFNSRVGSFIEIFIYAFSDASESHLLFNTKVTQLIDLYSPGVMPVRRRKYFEKNEGLAKCISSAICAAGLSVWRSSIEAHAVGIVAYLVMLGTMLGDQLEETVENGLFA